MIINLLPLLVLLYPIVLFLFSLSCFFSVLFLLSWVVLLEYLSCFIIFFFRLVEFIDSYDPPVKGLQEDLNFVSPRIGEVICMFC